MVNPLNPIVSFQPIPMKSLEIPMFLTEITIVLWFSYGFPLVFLWFSCGFPMVFLWFSYGFLPESMPKWDPWLIQDGLIDLRTSLQGHRDGPPCPAEINPPGLWAYMIIYIYI